MLKKGTHAKKLPHGFIYIDRALTEQRLNLVHDRGIGSSPQHWNLQAQNLDCRELRHEAQLVWPSQGKKKWKKKVFVTFIIIKRPKNILEWKEIESPWMFSRSTDSKTVFFFFFFFSRLLCWPHVCPTPKEFCQASDQCTSPCWLHFSTSVGQERCDTILVLFPPTRNCFVKHPGEQVCCMRTKQFHLVFYATAPRTDLHKEIRYLLWHLLWKI